MDRKEVFVSFDFDNHKRYKYILEGWDTIPDSRFEFSNATHRPLDNTTTSASRVPFSAKINHLTDIIVIVVLISMTLMPGCKEQARARAQPRIATNEQRALVKDGTVMFSLVSGKRITKSFKTPALVYEGKLYFFCCDVDMRKFQANPDQYVNKARPPNGIDIGHTLRKD